MTDSILLTIKQMLGGVCSDETDTTFDTDLIVHINSTLAILNQMGIGKTGFTISSVDETWSDFLEDDNKEVQDGLAMVKSAVFFRVKKLFDPATGSAVKEANNDSLQELEWRLHSLVNY